MKDNYDLFKHLDEYLVSKSGWKNDPSGYMYPTEASVKYRDTTGAEVIAGKCHRAAFMRHFPDQFPQLPNPPKSEYIFIFGKQIENSLTSLFKEMGVWVANNVKFKLEEHFVSGEIDTILKEPDGTEYCLEQKTIYGYFATKEIFGNKSQVGFPKIEHLLQTLTYLYRYRDRIPYARISYLARDSMARKTFKIELKEEGPVTFPVVDGNVVRWFTLNDVFDRYAELKGYIDRKEVPPKEFELKYSPEKIEHYYSLGKISKTKYAAWKSNKLRPDEHIGDWNCAYCSMRAECWGKAAEPSPMDGQ